MDTDQRSRLVLIVIGATLIVLVAVALVMAVQPPPEFDPATPQGAAQGYFRAVVDRDPNAAFDYLADDIRSECNRGELRHVTPDGARVVIAATEVTADEATVEVEITETWGEGPFDAGPGRLSFDETLFMERHGDRWLITETPWPIHDYCR